eukprot:365898-Chlamydomonas_euryale.AAC.3
MHDDACNQARRASVAIGIGGASAITGSMSMCYQRCIARACCVHEGVAANSVRPYSRQPTLQQPVGSIDAIMPARANKGRSRAVFGGRGGRPGTSSISNMKSAAACSGLVGTTHILSD